MSNNHVQQLSRSQPSELTIVHGFLFQVVRGSNTLNYWEPY